MAAGTAQESRLAIVIDTAKAEERIKELRKQLAELGGQSDETSDDLDNLGDNANNAGGGAENLGSASDKAKKSLDKLGKAAAIAGAALAGAIGLSINKAQSWETAMSEINKTVDFAAEDGLANMRKGLQELTTRIPQTFEELAAVTATGGQLGIAEDNLLHFTEVMAKMGVAFDIPAQQAADSMAKIANVFQIPIENIDRLGDAINTLSNNTPATAAQLIDSLQRVGGVAKVFGLSEDATLGLTGALIAMGKPAEVASTAVNSLLTTFSTLDNATKSQILGFRKLGLDMDEFSKLVATDGKQAIITYLEAINKLEQSERIGTNAMIIGKEFGDDITMLAGSVGVLENNWAMLGETAGTTKEYFGSMDKEFVKISETSANKMKLFKQNIDGVVVGIGEAFIPALNDLLFNMTPLITTLSVWVSENPELIKQIAVIGGALIGSIAGLKLAVDGFEAAKTALDGLRFAYAALASPMGLTVLGLGILLAAGLLVYQNWDKIKQVVSDNIPIFAAVAGVVTVITGALAAVYGPMLLAAAGAAAMSAATTIWTGVVTIATGVTAAFGAVLAFIASPIGIAVIAIGALVAAGIYLYKNWDEVKAKATEVWGSITKYIGDKVAAIKNYFTTNFPAMSAIVGGSLKIMGTMFSSGFALIKNTVTTVMDVIKAVISGDFKAIPGIIWNGLKAAAGIVTNMMGSILNIIKATGAKLFEVGKQLVQGLINGIKSSISGVTNAISDMASSAVAKAKSVLDIRSPSRVMKKVGEQTAQGMANGIKKGAKVVQTEAQKMAEQAVKSVNDGIASLKKEIALFGSDSPTAELLYDIGVGKYKGVPQAALDTYESLLIKKHNLIEADKTQAKLDSDTLERSNQIKRANESVVSSVADIQKQIALFGNSTAVSDLLYDMKNTSKYADVAAENMAKLYDNTRELQLLKDQKSANDALGSVMNELVQESPMGKIQADYEQRLEVVRQFEQLHTDEVQKAAEARMAVEQSYQDAKRNLMLTQGEALFGDLAGLAKGFAGEQSGIYKALFAVEKGFAIAQSAIAIQQSIAKAMAVGFPANIPLIGQAVSQGMGIMSSIKSITAGFKKGGYTGGMGVNDVAGVVHGQEYVFDAQATRRIGVDNLNAMRSGKSVGGDVQVNIINNSSARVTASDDGKTITIEDVRNENKRSWSNLSNPNSFESKQVNRNIQAPRRR